MAINIIFQKQDQEFNGNTTATHAQLAQMAAQAVDPLHFMEKPDNKLRV